MFTIETRINGALIGVLYGRNEGPSDPPGFQDRCRYTYRHHDVQSGKVREGEVIHYRTDGITNLVSRIFADMDEKGGQ